MIYKEPPFPIRERISRPKIDPSKDRNRFGRMVYGHKTAGEICVMTKEQFDDFKSYEPGRCGISSLKTRTKASAGGA